MTDGRPTLERRVADTGTVGVRASCACCDRPVIDHADGCPWTLAREALGLDERSS